MTFEQVLLWHDQAVSWIKDEKPLMKEENILLNQTCQEQANAIRKEIYG